jgi:hypothetical protein
MTQYLGFILMSPLALVYPKKIKNSFLFIFIVKRKNNFPILLTVKPAPHANQQETKSNLFLSNYLHKKQTAIPWKQHVLPSSTNFSSLASSF